MSIGNYDTRHSLHHWHDLANR